MTEERAADLIRMATELVMRVRDVDPERNAVWLATLSVDDWRELLIVLAAMVDPEQPMSMALGWTIPLAREAA